MNIHITGASLAIAAAASLSIIAIRKSKKEDNFEDIKLNEFDNIGNNEEWAVDAYNVGSIEKEDGIGKYPVYLLNMGDGSYICALRFRMNNYGKPTDEDGEEMPEKYNRWRGREDEDVIVELREWKINCKEEKKLMIKEIGEAYGRERVKRQNHPALRRAET